jgi:hypothetical protein
MADNIHMVHPAGGETYAHVTQVENMKTSGWKVAAKHVINSPTNTKKVKHHVKN